MDSGLRPVTSPVPECERPGHPHLCFGNIPESGAPALRSPALHLGFTHSDKTLNFTPVFKLAVARKI
jgi:hypothetical protein